MEKGYKDIIEVRKTNDEAIVNDLLSQGWIILNATSGYKGGCGFQLITSFVLGRKEVKVVKK